MYSKIKKVRKVFKRHGLILCLVIGLIILGTLGWIIKNNLTHAETLQSLADTQKDIFYCNSKNLSQSLDFYHPKEKVNETVPLLVYIHGGGWMSGSKNSRLISTYGPLFIKHGIAVASINYRLKSTNPYPDQNNDVACALTYLSDHAKQLHIDAGKSLFFGESAGGQLAAFAALNVPYKQYDYEAPIGVIDFYGVSDFSKIVGGTHPDFNARRYLGPKYAQAIISASPTTYVTKHAPRFLLIHGTSDRVVPMLQSRSLYDLLVKSGIHAKYITLPGVNHGFTGPELSVNNYKTIQDNLIIFLQETLKQ